ncbi:MAG: 16S rRNA (guanine(527)-N(7))-methyltransferase RsmG [Candidatus Latescibacteria bacterium]|nr:16S rRNA (guanine(527)-N(7))-methyltransferase RsmG [Candidatus Latescibacterota bacterium]
MPNGNAAARSVLQLPRDLEPDYSEFEKTLAPRVASGNISTEAFHLLGRFGQLVYTQVAQLSLVASGDRTVVYTRHILDSLNPIELLSDPPRSALDIGSGGGFPGIPLAIVWPQTSFTVLESREKKAGFLERAVRELRLPNVTVVCARLEEFGRSWTAEPHECLFVRALGNLPETLRMAERVAAPGARWVYFMGATAPAWSISDLGPMGAGSIKVRGAFGGALLVGRVSPEPSAGA